jgi:hypothetical protein
MGPSGGADQRLHVIPLFFEVGKEGEAVGQGHFQNTTNPKKRLDLTRRIRLQKLIFLSLCWPSQMIYPKNLRLNADEIV